MNKLLISKIIFKKSMTNMKKSFKYWKKIQKKCLNIIILIINI
jgi:hypothetical protein